MGTKPQVIQHMDKTGLTSLERATEIKGVNHCGALENQPDHRAPAVMGHTHKGGDRPLSGTFSLFLSVSLSRPLLHFFFSFYLSCNTIIHKVGAEKFQPLLI